MIRALVILIATLLPLLLAFSAVGLHIELFVKNNFSLHQGQLDFPEILMPTNFMVKGGISISLIIAAGLSVGLHHLIYKKLIVQRFGLVSNEQYSKLFGSAKKQ